VNNVSEAGGRMRPSVKPPRKKPAVPPRTPSNDEDLRPAIPDSDYAVDEPDEEVPPIPPSPDVTDEVWQPPPSPPVPPAPMVDEEEPVRFDHQSAARNPQISKGKRSGTASSKAPSNSSSSQKRKSPKNRPDSSEEDNRQLIQKKKSPRSRQGSNESKASGDGQQISPNLTSFSSSTSKKSSAKKKSALYGSSSPKPEISLKSSNKQTPLIELDRMAEMPGLMVTGQEEKLMTGYAEDDANYPQSPKEVDDEVGLKSLFSKNSQLIFKSTGCYEFKEAVQRFNEEDRKPQDTGWNILFFAQLFGECCGFSFLQIDILISYDTTWSFLLLFQWSSHHQYF
jgi:hypothetical protein